MRMFNTKDSLESREAAERAQRRMRINLLAGSIRAVGSSRRRVRRRRIGLRISHRQLPRRKR